MGDSKSSEKNFWGCTVGTTGRSCCYMPDRLGRCMIWGERKCIEKKECYSSRWDCVADRTVAEDKENDEEGETGIVKRIFDQCRVGDEKGDCCNLRDLGGRCVIYGKEKCIRRCKTENVWRCHKK